MRKYLCKIFRFLLDLVGQVVDLVANTLIKVGTAAVEVLSEVAGAVGKSILKSPLGWVVIGLGAYFIIPKLFPSEDEDDDPKLETQGI